MWLRSPTTKDTLQAFLVLTCFEHVLNTFVEQNACHNQNIEKTTCKHPKYPEVPCPVSAFRWASGRSHGFAKARVAASGICHSMPPQPQGPNAVTAVTYVLDWTVKGWVTLGMKTTTSWHGWLGFTMFTVGSSDTCSSLVAKGLIYRIEWVLMCTVNWEKKLQPTARKTDPAPSSMHHILAHSIG